MEGKGKGDEGGVTELSGAFLGVSGALIVGAKADVGGSTNGVSFVAGASAGREVAGSSFPSIHNISLPCSLFCRC